jgi:hypothetical protein
VYVVAVSLGINGSGVEHFFILVEVLYELRNPAIVMEFRLLVGAFVLEAYGKAFIEE